MTKKPSEKSFFKSSSESLIRWQHPRRTFLSNFFSKSFYDFFPLMSQDKFFFFFDRTVDAQNDAKNWRKKLMRHLEIFLQMKIYADWHQINVKFKRGNIFKKKTSFIFQEKRVLGNRALFHGFVFVSLTLTRKAFERFWQIRNFFSDLIKIKFCLCGPRFVFSDKPSFHSNP